MTVEACRFQIYFHDSGFGELVRQGDVGWVERARATTGVLRRAQDDGGRTSNGKSNSNGSGNSKSNYNYNNNYNGNYRGPSLRSG